MSHNRAILRIAVTQRECGDPRCDTMGAERTVGKIELLKEIKSKLEQARNLSAEAGSFTLPFLIEMAILNTTETTEKISPSERAPASFAAHGEAGAHTRVPAGERGRLAVSS